MYLALSMVAEFLLVLYKSAGTLDLYIYMPKSVNKVPIQILMKILRFKYILLCTMHHGHHFLKNLDLFMYG